MLAKNKVEYVVVEDELGLKDGLLSSGWTLYSSWLLCGLRGPSNRNQKSDKPYVRTHKLIA